MKYLDERLNVTFTGVTLSGLVVYKVSYAGKVIFVGNCYISSTEPTLDITDIVRSYEATLSEYGTRHTYQVGLYKSSSSAEAAYSASLQVANIYRYPHRLKNYSSKLQYYYADCNGDGDLKLPARYPDNSTTAIVPEFYKTSDGYVYSPNRSEISAYKGNADCVMGDLINKQVNNWPDATTIGTTDDTGTIFEIKSVILPTNLYITNYDDDSSQEEEYYLVDSFPYVNSFSAKSQLADNPYLLDLYIGDAYDEYHNNIYPQFFAEFINDETPRYEDLNLSINKVDNKLGEDFFGDTEFEVTGNKLTYDYSNIQAIEFYINAYDESGSNLWEAPFDTDIEGDIYIQDDAEYAFTDISYLEVTCNDDYAPTLEIDLNTNKCQTNGFKIHYKTVGSGNDISLALTFEDTYYDCLCLFNLYVKNHTNTSAYANYSFDWTTKKAGTAENIMLEKVTNTNSNMDYKFSNTASHTTTVKVYGKDGVVVANKTYAYNSSSTQKEYKLFDDYLFVTDFYIDITANYTDGSYARVISYVPGNVYFVSNIKLSNSLVSLQCQNYTTSSRATITSTIYTYDLTYSLPISELACPTGYFLQWRDRWGSLQCQPFEKVSTYSEEITASEITTYYDKRSIYKTENQPKWKIQTGWLTDDLYPVYEGIFISGVLTLYDADTDTAYDVILKDRNYTEKTFCNQGKMFNLELTLELSEKQNILY